MNKFCFLFPFLIIYSFILNGQNDYRKELEVCEKLGYFKGQACMEGNQIFEYDKISYTGKKISSDDLKGKIIVINFWFMSCPPCIAELGGLNEIVDKYQDKNVAFISFTFDSKMDLAKDFFPNHEFKFEVIADQETFLIEELAHGWGFPTTFIVDQEGYIEKIFSGGSTEEEIANTEIKEQVIPVLEQLLKEEK